MAYIFGRNDRFYVAKQVSYDTIRNTAGAANVAAGDACKHISFSATPNRSRLAAPEKEANSFLGYIDSTRAGRFVTSPASVVTPIFSASGAGVQPDNGPILESAFGQVAIGAGVSVTYSLLATGLVTCELWGFNAANKRGMVAYGALVNSLRISAGQDFAELAADFICFYALSQDRFPAASTAEKGGLTAWPTEPASQTYTGTALTGFTGALTLDGVPYTNVRNITLNMNMARQFRADKFDDDGSEFLPTEPFELMPEITLDFSLHSTDSADLTALLAKIAARTQFDASFTLGATAGGIYTFSLNNLISPSGAEAVNGDGDDRKAISVSGLRAQATDTSTRNEVGLVIT